MTVRTAEAARMHILTANILTTIRLLSIPVVIALLLDSQWKTTLGLLIFLQATDVADGYLARRASRIAPSPVRNLYGAIVDPVADKLLLNGVYVTLSAMGRFPWWPTVVFVVKDLLLIAGWAVVSMGKQTRTVRPNVFGKTAETLQMLLVLLVLLEMPAGLVSALTWVTVASVLLAGAMYARREGDSRSGENGR